MIWETNLLTGFNGSFGWISINEFDAIYPQQGKTLRELGVTLLQELVAKDGTIFMLLAQIEVAQCPY